MRLIRPNPKCPNCYSWKTSTRSSVTGKIELVCEKCGKVTPLGVEYKPKHKEVLGVGVVTEEQVKESREMREKGIEYHRMRSQK